MTRKEVNDLYEASVFQIRLRVAIQLLSVPGITPPQALDEADHFIKHLLTEEKDELIARFP
jgi:hypothetical protein